MSSIYGRIFFQAASLRFYTKYAEYERNMELNNYAQSTTRPVLSIAQLLRKSIRSCLSRTYFDGTELEEADLREALAKHAECWTGDSPEPSIAAGEVFRRVTMGSESTAADRTDAVQSRLEQYFENPSAESVYREARGTFQRLGFENMAPGGFALHQPDLQQWLRTPMVTRRHTFAAVMDGSIESPVQHSVCLTRASRRSSPRSSVPSK